MMVATNNSSRWLSLMAVAIIIAAPGVVANTDDDGCYAPYFADGYCDEYNNKESCGFDGGDCCACTCASTQDYTCGENGYACVDPDATCVDDDDVTIEMLENCGDVSAIGDGFCDADNNKEVCNFDGGDCCECTCTTSDNDNNWICRSFACIDPSAPCVDDDDVTAEMVDACWVRTIGDGYCDSINNNALCTYDGGDCCECTCVGEVYLDDDYTSYSSCASNFACIDPDAPCVDDDDITIDTPESCNSVTMSNAFCDDGNNNAECGYDGGDCCECTCEDRPPNTLCGQHASFSCIDPDAACANDDDITIGMVGICATSRIGNGLCDEQNNNAECNYDGGDCCECTCSTGIEMDDDYRCSYRAGFACVDPSAPCVDDDSVTVDMMVECDAVDIGNGVCNDANNSPECAYDGGDCCECTCTGDSDSSCMYWFACIDPDAPCVDDDEVTADMYDNCNGPTGIGNGHCDSHLNTEECGYDGGDCCSCTCESIAEWGDYFSCQVSEGFDCKDETAPCFGEESTMYGDDDDDEWLSYEFVAWEQEGDLPTVDGAVEVGEKTEVAVTATAYDVRPGASSGMVGCGEVGGNGCEPLNSRDGISSEIESRWSCASKIVPDGGPCQIEYTFAEAQDIMDIQVAFWKGDERTRTLEVHLDGIPHHTHESYAESTFNTLGVVGTGVTTVTLQSVDVLADEWISLLEVLIFVTP